mmetsp:Transcript_26915/g.63069  ORF Transcript_26915/g.63069 Transcript_26915/m.63069 type:complete len:279 (-) Transcript_26915:68-904(-)
MLADDEVGAMYDLPCLCSDWIQQLAHDSATYRPFVPAFLSSPPASPRCPTLTRDVPVLASSRGGQSIAVLNEREPGQLEALASGLRANRRGLVGEVMGMLYSILPILQSSSPEEMRFRILILPDQPVAEFVAHSAASFFFRCERGIRSTVSEGAAQYAQCAMMAWLLGDQSCLRLHAVNYLMALKDDPLANHSTVSDRRWFGLLRVSLEDLVNREHNYRSIGEFDRADKLEEFAKGLSESFDNFDVGHYERCDGYRVESLRGYDEDDDDYNDYDDDDI